MKIVVLAGGYSPEREVSLTSGSLIANALMNSGHRVLLLDAYLGLPALPENPDTLFSSVGHYEHLITEQVPSLADLKAASGNGDALIGKNVIELCKMADKVFLALHGSMGENGQMQATLDSFGISYTGSGYDGSLLAMDKDLAKRLMRDAGVRTPDWVYVDAKACNPKEILEKIGLPCVVKPCGCGSSVGVSMVDCEEDFLFALEEAAKWGRSILVERRIYGRELAIGILDREVLPPVEIVVQDGFYDYRNKYQGKTREICPAEISDAVLQNANDLVRKAFSALRLHGYARFDFLLDAGGDLWCLEANTLPGMTPMSLLPQAAAAAGYSYEALCEKIIQL